MEQEIQNLEYLKDFFFNRSVEIDITNFFVALILSAILSFLIKKVYIYSSQTLSNKNYFSDLFVPLGIITCLVITVIKFSLALSLGLVGALSIVRFRAAIKEPEELIYLFLIIGIGLACGANQFLIAIIATLVISVILISFKYFRNKKDSSRNVDLNILQVELKNKKINVNEIINIIEQKSIYCNLKSTNTNSDGEIYTFWVEFKNQSDFFELSEMIKKISDKEINLNFYSSENIYE